MKHSGAGTGDAYKITWQFSKRLLSLNDNLISRSTNTNMSKEAACSDSDDQECLYQTEELVPSKKSQ